MTIIQDRTTPAQAIPIEYLEMSSQTIPEYGKTLLADEIQGIKVEHIALAADAVLEEHIENGYKNIYLFIKGHGHILADKESYSIEPEFIFLPNSLQNISIKVNGNDSLNFLRISSELTEEDILDLKEFPEEHTQKPYSAKFTDCEAYTEPIKSPNTVSRTVLHNKYIPRIALGTVETSGPDKVAPHEHPMLEQLFLGLAGNNVIVYADEVKTDFPEYSLLHIPLGSSHSVEVEKGNKMYYIWMDFFMDKEGEEWLKTHNHLKK